MGKLWRRWVLAFTLGELVGFGFVPALGGVVLAYATEGVNRAPRALLLYAALVALGFGEGAVLARFQIVVLRSVVPGLSSRRWIVSTGVAASVAWAAGMLPSTLDDLFVIPRALQVVLWVLASLVILPSIGIAQARVLAGHTANPRRWVGANVLGWLAGLPWTFALPALLPDDAPPWAFALTMLAGGVLMGASAGAVTGWWLTRMFAAPCAPPDAGIHTA